jgi:hypothetical protein
MLAEQYHAHEAAWKQTPIPTWRLRAKQQDCTFLAEVIEEPTQPGKYRATWQHLTHPKQSKAGSQGLAGPFVTVEAAKRFCEQMLAATHDTQDCGAT